MKLKFTKEFRDKLNSQIDYISKDKPAAARKFKNDLITKISKIPGSPYSNRQSIFFEQKNIRDLVFKGYVVIYLIKLETKEIIVFGFTKYQQNP